ncbi:cytochrome P450 [Annulohypoxylon maeteangense]|uniref:cytochrome P450 n=1 Tax=Annulohypoxylon maeteangense TaxID=1927788 RepID=UPI00200831B2|nr:cytochrome P450 [Annulohypoxylon maeteangense]KAI0888279.1 cytochrome P450 [Annulohypoxylon maeteangense]
MDLFPSSNFHREDDVKDNYVAMAFVLGVSAVLSWLVISEVISPLNEYPGPFLAKWTNWWRFALVRTGSYHIRIKELHDQYGPVLRIGPNLLDLDIPKLVKTLYGSDASWQKTEFYKNNSVVINGKTTYQLFSEIDPASHARMKRPIAKFFGHGMVLSKEVLMDKAIIDLCSHLEYRYHEKSCDLGEWIAFCAWDILGNMTFSQPFGYMDKGYDFDHSLSIADKSLDYFAAVGQIPFLDNLLDKNPIIRLGPPNLGNITLIATKHLTERLAAKDFKPSGALDYLQHFIDVNNSDPNVTETDILMNLLTTLIAGADTTAITIRTIFYYSLRNPPVYRRLEEEILAAKLAEPAPYSLARALPYLEATVREAMRIHPSVCMLLERYVPEPGLTLPDGNYIPPGTAVGINPYVLGRNNDIWGPDANEFRPERWLRGEEESEDAYRGRMKRFNAADLTFGGGSRMCLGRYIAQMEVYKVVATLVSHFEIELADPTSEWKVVGSWFPRQKGLKCHLKSRS